jgi:hypothetical protein
MSRSTALSIFVRLVLCAFIAVTLFALMFVIIHPVEAQTGGFGVSITTPVEGETFYAGPTTWAYSINVGGDVTGVKGDPTQVQVTMAIYQGTELKQTVQTNPAADGSYKIDFTVNPEGSDPVMTVDMLTRHCTSTGRDNLCHYRAAYTLPAGHVVVRVTAKMRGASDANAERHIIVDRSAYATVPVKVVLADHPEQPVVGVTAIGTAWMYSWRARSVSGATDASGVANLTKVEALSQAPTHYVFRVEPSVVDGIVYESVASVDVVLPPGATLAPQITLRVRGRTGEIRGETHAPTATALHAIHLPDGKSYATQSTSESTFLFADLPIGEYLIAADGYAGVSDKIDLAQSSVVSVTLPLIARPPNILRGVVRDAQGVPLPFGWVAVENAGLTQRIMPGSGAYALSDVPSGVTTAVASAPGFYYQAQVADVPSGGAGTLDYALVRRPETKSIACGKGEIILPPESQVSIEANQIVLDYGWLWGGAADCLPAPIRVDQTEIALTDARFAIEHLTDGTSWLYVQQGTATVHSNRTVEAVAVHAGEMLALTDAIRMVPVPYDPLAIAVMSPVPVSPVSPIWEASLEAQVRDRLAEMGIQAAQVVTLLTYSLIVLILGIAPLFGIAYWLRHRRAQIVGK